ncbi:MAG: hypothetical protein HY052_08860 [Proteobacteria bacterium]|nr:hypothetical protein [Pseudomonadota bacterium]
MGDINFDLTKNKKFLLLSYTLAAAGAVTGIALTSAATVPAIIVAGAVGAVAGGVGVPVVATAVAGGAAGLFSLAKGWKRSMNELAVIPLGVAVVGMSSAKAMFGTPFQAVFKGLKSAFNRKAARSGGRSPAVKAPAPKP